MKKATLAELDLINIPCGFVIKYFAASDPTDSNDFWWHVYNEMPVWNASSRKWEILTDSGEGYEVGGYAEDDVVPNILLGFTPDNSLFEVTEKTCIVNVTEQDNELSGCELKSSIEKIGYENIALLSDTSELIKHINNECLLDALCNDNDRDITFLIKELFKSELVLNSTHEKELTLKMEALLTDIFKI